jgi:hypothetical protein
MSASAATVKLIPLVPNLVLPRVASARTRTFVPPGYGVQEQCLPFTAASALGVIIPSPIRFGFCTLEELPSGCRAFRSPANRLDTAGNYAEPRLLYVFDNPEVRFTGNAYELRGISGEAAPAATVQEPGLSFFDRDDQSTLIKLHLPYIWRTPDMVDTLFLPLLNRNSFGIEVKCGLVETDWYASPVNLVLGLPPGPLHIGIGDPVAQAIFVPRALRRPHLDQVSEHDQLNMAARQGLADWDRRHAEDRSLYKMLARSAVGRIDRETSPGPGEKR